MTPDTAHASGRALSFAVTYDYRCPFARNVHEHVLLGLAAGAPWEVQFVPFSLLQVHVSSGDPDVWDDRSRRDDLLALEAGLVVRDDRADRFVDVHRGLFAARHDRGLDLRDTRVVGSVLEDAGVEAAEVLERVSEGTTLQTLRREHEAAASEHHVFGVPTMIIGSRAAFVRLMSRPMGAADVAVETVERLVDITTGWPELNELKHTTVPR